MAFIRRFEQDPCCTQFKCRQCMSTSLLGKRGWLACHRRDLNVWKDFEFTYCTAVIKVQQNLCYGRYQRARYGCLYTMRCRGNDMLPRQQRRIKCTALIIVLFKVFHFHFHFNFIFIFFTTTTRSPSSHRTTILTFKPSQLSGDHQAASCELYRHLHARISQHRGIHSCMTPSAPTGPRRCSVRLQATPAHHRSASRVGGVPIIHLRCKDAPLALALLFQMPSNKLLWREFS